MTSRRGIILVFQNAAEMAEDEIGLSDVGLHSEVNARFGLVGVDSREREGRVAAGIPRGEELFEFRLHLRRGEIALYGEDDVAWKEVALVERDHIVAFDIIDGRIFDVPTVGVVLP